MRVHNPFFLNPIFNETICRLASKEYFDVFQDAIKYENGRDVAGSSIIVEWAKGNPRRPLISRVSVNSYFIPKFFLRPKKYIVMFPVK